MTKIYTESYETTRIMTQKELWRWHSRILQRWGCCGESDGFFQGENNLNIQRIVSRREIFNRFHPKKHFPNCLSSQYNPLLLPPSLVKRVPRIIERVSVLVDLAVHVFRIAQFALVLEPMTQPAFNDIIMRSRRHHYYVIPAGVIIVVVVVVIIMVIVVFSRGVKFIVESLQQRQCLIMQAQITLGRQYVKATSLRLHRFHASTPCR